MPPLIGSMLAGLGLGLALAGSPGPVQAILLAESIRGGASRGFRAQAGANITFGFMLVALAPTERRRLPPAARGLLAVVLNPGTYLFLATAASSVLSSASRQGGIAAALLAALALVVGVAIGDGTVVLFGGLGVRRAGARVIALVRSVLAGLLALLGVALIVNGIV